MSCSNSKINVNILIGAIIFGIYWASCVTFTAQRLQTAKYARHQGTWLCCIWRWRYQLLQYQPWRYQPWRYRAQMNKHQFHIDEIGVHEINHWMNRKEPKEVRWHFYGTLNSETFFEWCHSPIVTYRSHFVSTWHLISFTHCRSDSSGCLPELNSLPFRH